LLGAASQLPRRAVVDRANSNAGSCATSCSSASLAPALLLSFLRLYGRILRLRLRCLLRASSRPCLCSAHVAFARPAQIWNFFCHWHEASASNTAQQSRP
jgi:hypothetical protein